LRRRDAMQARDGSRERDRDAYEGFADRYDLFFGEFEAYSPRLEEFFKKVFEDNGVKRVLDCACGTGRHLYLFHKLGFEAVGSDVSPAMLAVARKNLEDRSADIRLSRVDYRGLPEHFNEKFDAVVCLTSAICEMPDSVQMLQALKSMRQALRDGGILILSQGTTDKQWAEKPRFILVEDNLEYTRLFVVDYFDKGARYNVVDVFHRGDESDVKTWGIDYPHMVFRDGQENLLKSAGFKDVEFYGSYSFEPYSKAKSNHLITVAHA
jgi:glycine/sarcosine N-methyltransferase